MSKICRWKEKGQPINECRSNCKCMLSPERRDRALNNNKNASSEIGSPKLRGRVGLVSKNCRWKSKEQLDAVMDYDQWMPICRSNCELLSPE
jgi:hypothetical protein